MNALNAATDTMIDPFGRAVSYLRVSVTDRCDFRCVYCMSEDMAFLPKKDLLTLEELDRLCSVFIDKGVKKLRITGGEPLLGWQKSYAELLTHPFMAELKEITFETNGTQELSASLYNFLRGWVAQNPEREITFSVSPKLSISGEAHDDAINPKIVAEYQDVGYTYLKFVVAHDTDITEVEEVVDEYRKEGFKGPVYLMPLGGVEQLYSVNSRGVAEAAMQRGYRYSDRLQVPLFKNEWGT